ncbi:MAG: DUF4058 family protein [Chloroflexota bacterium]|nr:DUF4058 family protein [Chloroflexota bacterium]
MNTLHSIKNQYRGINAHFHSHLLHESAWNRLHNYHIGKLMESLKAQLLPMGYTAQIEESLQIRRLDSVDTFNRRADLMIRDLQTGRMGAGTLLAERDIIPLIDLLPEDSESPYSAVALIERASGDVVAWVELLSPSNKGETRDAHSYLAKRRLLLESGVTVVELDYLHDSPPTFPRTPDYRAGGAGAHPYRVALLDPHPNFRDGRSIVRGFDVDTAIPSLDVPLRAGDHLLFDFDAAYQKTFADGLFGLEEIDYAQLPARFDLYQPDDQARILNRMIAVLNAANAGIDLETVTLVPAALPLDEGLRELQRYSSL